MKIGDIVGNYRLIGLIGEGGMSSVFEAEHNRLGRKVAIKVLHPSFLQNSAIRNRFINEAQMMEVLQHPNITRVLDFHDSGDELCLVMEFLDGVDLNKWVKLNGPMQTDRILSILNQILPALQYAHDKGVIHRDIKPSNIFVNPDGHVKILDFGISKLIGSSSDTVTGTYLGTPMYMSPEQVKDTKNINHLSDIYSLGVTIYFLVTGKAPYSASDSQFSIWTKIVQEPLPGIFDIGVWGTIVEMACKKDASDRYQNCTLFLQDVSSISVHCNHTIVPDTESTIVTNSSIHFNNDDNYRNPRGGFYGTISPFEEFNDWISYNKYLRDCMVNVDSGTFTMGCTSDQDIYGEIDEYPTRSVKLKDFKIGKFLVTQRDWLFVMGNNPSHFDYSPTCPVENVSWNEIQLFLDRLNANSSEVYRLPTEAEWEYAARGGQFHEKYWYSGSQNIEDSAWYDENSESKTHPVGSKCGNSLGLYDMSGNVYEWCQDRYGPYIKLAEEQIINPTGPDYGANRLIRGGSCMSPKKYCRVSYRRGMDPDISTFYTGFRLACG